MTLICVTTGIINFEDMICSHNVVNHTYVEAPITQVVN